VTQDVSSLGAEVASNANHADQAALRADDLHTVVIELGRTVREFRIERQARYHSDVARRVAVSTPRIEVVANAPAADPNEGAEFLFQKAQGMI
jgi:methyl-accepting chemotaxis protein